MNRVHQLLTSGRKHCYYIPFPPAIKVEGGFVPSLVFENEPGHFPMKGDPEKLQEPWVWGPTLKDAEKAAKAMNERMGVSEVDAIRIVASSMNS